MGRGHEESPIDSTILVRWHCAVLWSMPESFELEDGITFCHCNDARNGSAMAGTASKAGFGFHRIPSDDHGACSTCPWGNSCDLTGREPGGPGSAQGPAMSAFQVRNELSISLWFVHVCTWRNCIISIQCYQRTYDEIWTCRSIIKS